MVQFVASSIRWTLEKTCFQLPKKTGQVSPMSLCHRTVFQVTLNTLNLILTGGRKKANMTCRLAQLSLDFHLGEPSSPSVTGAPRRPMKIAAKSLNYALAIESCLLVLLLMSKNFHCQFGMPSLICCPDSFNFPYTATIYHGPEPPMHSRHFPGADRGELSYCQAGEDAVTQKWVVSATLVEPGNLSELENPQTAITAWDT